jgi:signal peptidase I
MAGTAAKKNQRSGFGGLVELVVTVAIAVGIAFLIQAFIVKPYRIPSVSMVPTLSVGQRILVNRLSRHPHVGDIVVFHPPAGADPDNPVCGSPDEGMGHASACDQPTPQESTQTFVKRVVAVGGDKIRIVNGKVFRNGKEETGKYVQPCPDSSQCTFPKTFTVPSGDYFMMGDNRDESDDSRFWGPIPQKYVIGVAFFTYWPPDRIGTL